LDAHISVGETLHRVVEVTAFACFQAALFFGFGLGWPRWLSIPFVAAGLAGLLLATRGGAPAKSAALRPGADVVLITVDALRADHLNARNSPNLLALAAESTVFERAYTVIPHTSFSMTSMLAGFYAHAAAQLGPIDGHPTLANTLGRAGWRTVAVYPPAVFYVERARFRGY